MRPDWMLNLQSFGSQAGTQSTEQHQPGQECFISLSHQEKIQLLNTALLNVNSTQSASSTIGNGAVIIC